MWKSGPEWPTVVFLYYFIESIASDGQAMNYLKGSEAYQYLHSSMVGCVLMKSEGDYIYLKAYVEPRQC